jgi:hypothetical protein
VIFRFCAIFFRVARIRKENKISSGRKKGGQLQRNLKTKIKKKKKRGHRLSGVVALVHATR